LHIGAGLILDWLIILTFQASLTRRILHFAPSPGLERPGYGQIAATRLGWIEFVRGQISARCLNIIAAAA
jgi:hypothetical protein